MALKKAIDCLEQLGSEFHEPQSLEGGSYELPSKQACIQ